MVLKRKRSSSFFRHAHLPSCLVTNMRMIMCHKLLSFLLLSFSLYDNITFLTPATMCWTCCTEKCRYKLLFPKVDIQDLISRTYLSLLVYSLMIWKGNFIFSLYLLWLDDPLCSHLFVFLFSRKTPAEQEDYVETFYHHRCILQDNI